MQREASENKARNERNERNVEEPGQMKFDWSNCEWGCRKVTVTYFDLTIVIIAALMNLSSVALIVNGSSTCTAFAIAFNASCFVFLICHVPFMCKRKFPIEVIEREISCQLAHNNILQQWVSRGHSRWQMTAFPTQMTRTISSNSYPEEHVKTNITTLPTSRTLYDSQRDIKLINTAPSQSELERAYAISAYDANSTHFHHYNSSSDSTPQTSQALQTSQASQTFQTSEFETVEMHI